MQLEQPTDVADGDQQPVSVTYGRASDLYRKVREHGVSSLSPKELEEWLQVEPVLAQLSANPAWQRTVEALKRQYPARAVYVTKCAAGLRSRRDLSGVYQSGNELCPVPA